MGQWRYSSKHFNTWGVVNLMAHLLTLWGRIGSIWVGGSAGSSASLNPVEKRGLSAPAGN
jgi:hypothetical protein